MAIDSKMLYSQLEQRLKDKPQITEKILAHIRAVSGKDSIAAFFNNGADEATKVEVLATCLRAVITSDFSKLKEAAPAPVTIAVAEPEPPKPPKMVPVWPPGNRMASPPPPVIEAQATVTANEPPPAAAAPPTDPRLASVMAAIQELAKPQPAAMIDEAQLRLMVEQVVAETMGKVVHAVIQRQIKKLMEHAATFTGE